MARVPRVKVFKFGAVGTALTVWDIWRRLPPRQRKWFLQQARMHGPRLAKQAYDAQKAARGKRR